MDQQQPPPPTPNAPPPSSAVDPPPQPQPQPQIQQQTTPTPPSSTSSTAIPNPNPNPIPKPLPSAIPPPKQPPQPKPALPSHQPRSAAAFSRPWQQHSAQFTHFSSSSPSASSSPSPSLSSQPRGSIALGVPSSHSGPSPPSPSPPQSTPFTGSFGHSFGGTSSSNVSQARPMMRGIGMGSSVGSSSQMRPGGISAQHQQRPLQSSLRPTSSPTSQSPSTQNFQGHGLMRVSAVPPQNISSIQQQEHFEQQFSQSRASQSLPHQQQDSRSQGSANQKPSSLAMVQPSTVQVTQNKAAITESDDSGGRILSKRSIHDIVNQIDPSEKLDPEVEDILVDIAEDFVDSITTFGCSLAKHRKSDTLEAKDILLHLERNWNLTLPGFSGDEIKTYKKPITNEVHKERLAVIKKSILAREAANAKHIIGQTAVNTKGNVGKAAANIWVLQMLKYEKYHEALFFF
ncbi:hypothetical protein ERO13_D01G128132v2 [Gossypium hirsutum]|nr:hypothetical protein ERO13_D01G128132v2 [Gossypium hirsutum]